MKKMTIYQRTKFHINSVTELCRAVAFHSGIRAFMRLRYILLK